MSGNSDSTYIGCSFFPKFSLFSYLCVTEKKGLNEKEEELESSCSSEGVNSYEELPIFRLVTIAEGVPPLEAFRIEQPLFNNLDSFSSDYSNKQDQSTNEESSDKEFLGFEEQPSEQPESKSSKKESPKAVGFPSKDYVAYKYSIKNMPEESQADQQSFAENWARGRW